MNVVTVPDDSVRQFAASGLSQYKDVVLPA